MSIECMAWALEQQNLEPVDKLVLLGIANHADRDGGNAWPSLKTLAMYVGRSDQTVRRSIRELEKRGLLVVELHGGGTFKHNGYRSNLYRVIMHRPITHDRVDLSPMTGTPCHSLDSRTVHEPSMNQIPSNELMTQFENWWSIYPRKVGKVDAQKHFMRIMRAPGAPTIQNLVDGTHALIAEKREQKFVPHPSTWLRQGRWDDERVDAPAVDVVVERVPPEFERALSTLSALRLVGELHDPNNLMVSYSDAAKSYAFGILGRQV